MHDEGQVLAPSGPSLNRRSRSSRFTSWTRTPLISTVSGGAHGNDPDLVPFSPWFGGLFQRRRQMTLSRQWNLPVAPFILIVNQLYLHSGGEWLPSKGERKTTPLSPFLDILYSSRSSKSA